MALSEPSANQRRHLLVQATIAPLDADGVGAFAVGSVVWALLAAVLATQHAELAARGHLWWLWVCLAGLAIGVLALAYCLWRRHRR